MWSDIGAELKRSEEETRPRSANFWGPPIWHLDLVEYITSLRGHYKLGVLSSAAPHTDTLMLPPPLPKLH